MNASRQEKSCKRREKIGISMPCYFIHESVLNLTNYIIYSVDSTHPSNSAHTNSLRYTLRIAPPTVMASAAVPATENPRASTSSLPYTTSSTQKKNIAPKKQPKNENEIAIRKNRKKNQQQQRRREMET